MEQKDRERGESVRISGLEERPLRVAKLYSLQARNDELDFKRHKSNVSAERKDVFSRRDMYLEHKTRNNRHRIFFHAQQKGILHSVDKVNSRPVRLPS